MAKTIKFNLICDSKPIRTIEDLQNNFSIEDVLVYYNNKLLHRWLEVRGYSDELDKVSAITSEDQMVIIKALISIFNVLSDERKVEESIYMLRYLEERKQCYEIYKTEDYKVKSIIDDYEQGYRELVVGILENPYDMALIKANIEEIVSNYKWVLELDHRNLFYQLRKKSTLAVMCLLMNEQSRKYYLPIETEKKDMAGDIILDIDEEDERKDKLCMFQNICSMIQASDFKTKLGKNLNSFAGVTDGYWKDLEPKGKKYMIISMGVGDFVRSAGQVGGDLASTDIQNKFVIVEGVDYKSNWASHELLYMEV